MAELSAIQAATQARVLEKFRRDADEAQSRMQRMAHNPTSGQYVSAKRDYDIAIAALQREQQLMAAQSLSVGSVAAVQSKQNILQAQYEGVLRGPVDKNPAFTQAGGRDPMPTPGLPNGLTPAMLGSITTALRANSLATSFNRANPAPQTGFLSSVQNFVQQNPVLSLAGGIGLGAAAGGIVGNLLGRRTASRAVNPRTGLPYRRMNYQNNKALSRAVRRLNGYTKGNNRIEKAIRQAARSAK